MLANSLSKDNGKSRFYLNSFKLPLKKIDLEDECATEIDPKCESKAYKSEAQVPTPLIFGVHPFDYVGPIGGFKGYGWTTKGNERLLKKRLYVGKEARYAYVDGYIYIFNKEIDEIEVSGVFPDPRLLKPFQACEGEKSCWTEEQEAFIEDQWAEIVLSDITQINLRLALPNDKVQIKEDQNV